MNAKSLLIASAIAVGLAMPATAQQSTTMHRYASFFKYTDQAIKGMLDKPEDRAAALKGGRGKRREDRGYLFLPDGR
jgi:hypothetical protein